MTRFLLCLFLALFPLLAVAQETAAQSGASRDVPPIESFFYQEDEAPDAAGPDAEVAAPAPAPAHTATGLVQEKISNEFLYVMMLGSLCLASLYVVLYFLKSGAGSPRDMVNSAGLILIIFGTIILVLVVSTSEQLTAAIGVLGAIAGYLFRSVQEDTRKPEG